jgi:hypothetical protein
MMKLKVGHGSSGASDRFPIHSNHKTNKGFGVGKGVEHIRTVFLKFRSVNLDESHIIGSRL